jgi:hypothetical protein
MGVDFNDLVPTDTSASETRTEAELVENYIEYMQDGDFTEEWREGSNLERRLRPRDIADLEALRDKKNRDDRQSSNGGYYQIVD